MFNQPHFPSYDSQIPSHTQTFMANNINPQSASSYTPPNYQALQPNVEHRSELVIGRPMYLACGPLAGRTVRMELHEIQQAELGRRYGKIDRRPIDPPPVVLLRIFEVRYPGTSRQQEREIQYDTALTIGLICTVDLFPIPRPGESSIPQALLQPAPDSGSEPYSINSLPSSSSAYYYSDVEQPLLDAYSGGPYRTGYPTNTGVSALSNEMIHRVGGYCVTESTKQTQALAGNTFVQPIIAEYGGRNAIMFVFNDLSVKLEGYFILRYRVFDIYSQECAGNNTSDRSVMAECYGGVFRMYPSKTFPGLPPSTELTKRLALYNGTRVNVRNEERHRRM